MITTSVDGHVKLWKKQADSVEFVKHYRASLNSITAVSADHEGKVFATVSEGGEGRVFDVVNFGEQMMAPSSCMASLRLIPRHRHDQHPEIRLHAQGMLLGASSLGWTFPACYVSEM